MQIWNFLCFSNNWVKVYRLSFALSLKAEGSTLLKLGKLKHIFLCLSLLNKIDSTQNSSTPSFSYSFHRCFHVGGLKCWWEAALTSRSGSFSFLWWLFDAPVICTFAPCQSLSRPVCCWVICSSLCFCSLGSCRQFRILLVYWTTSLGQLTNSQALLNPSWGHGKHLGSLKFLQGASYPSFMQLFPKHQVSPM